MAASKISFGPAKWQEPCYYFPKVQELPPTYSLYDRLTVNSPDIPSCYPRHSTPPPSRNRTPPPRIPRPSPFPARGRYLYSINAPRSSMYRNVAPGIRVRSSGQRIRLNYNKPNGPMVVMDFAVALEEYERRQRDKVTLYKIVTGLCDFLSEWVHMGSQYPTSLFWRGIWAVLCLFLRETSKGAKADNVLQAPTSARETLEVARSIIPLAGGSGGGWSALYDSLDARAALSNEKEQIDSEEDIEDNNEDAKQEKACRTDTTSTTEEQRRSEMAMKNYLRLVS